MNTIIRGVNTAGLIAIALITFVPWLLGLFGVTENMAGAISVVGLFLTTFLPLAGKSSGNRWRFESRVGMTIVFIFAFFSAFASQLSADAYAWVFVLLAVGIAVTLSDYAQKNSYNGYAGLLGALTCFVVAVEPALVERGVAWPFILGGAIAAWVLVAWLTRTVTVVTVQEGGPRQWSGKVPQDIANA